MTYAEDNNRLAGTTDKPDYEQLEMPFGTDPDVPEGDYEFESEQFGTPDTADDDDYIF